MTNPSPPTPTPVSEPPPSDAERAAEERRRARHLQFIEQAHVRELADAA